MSADLTREQIKGWYANLCKKGWNMVGSIEVRDMALRSLEAPPSAIQANLTERAILDLLVKNNLIASAALDDPEGYDQADTLVCARNFCHAILKVPPPEEREKK